MEHDGVMEDKAQKIYVACFNWPAHVMASITFAEKELKKAREEFETALRRKIDDFERVIELFEQEVFHVQKFGDVDKVGDYVRHIADLEERFPNPDPKPDPNPNPNSNWRSALRRLRPMLRCSTTRRPSWSGH